MHQEFLFQCAEDAATLRYVAVGEYELRCQRTLRVVADAQGFKNVHGADIGIAPLPAT